MASGVPARVTPVTRGARTREPRTVLGEIVQDLVQQWARASHAHALSNARRAATAASAAGVERAEVDAWLEAQQGEAEEAEAGV